MLNYIYFLDVNDKACTFSQDEVEKFVSIDTRSEVYWMVRKVVVMLLTLYSNSNLTMNRR